MGKLFLASVLRDSTKLSTAAQICQSYDASVDTTSLSMIVVRSRLLWALRHPDTVCNILLLAPKLGAKLTNFIVQLALHRARDCLKLLQNAI